MAELAVLVGDDGGDFGNVGEEFGAGHGDDTSRYATVVEMIAFDLLLLITYCFNGDYGLFQSIVIDHGHRPLYISG